MVKIVEYNGQYRITLPKELVEERKWKPGTKIRFVEDINGNIFIKEVSKRK